MLLHNGTSEGLPAKRKLTTTVFLPSVGRSTILVGFRMAGTPPEVSKGSKKSKNILQTTKVSLYGVVVRGEVDTRQWRAHAPKTLR